MAAMAAVRDMLHAMALPGETIARAFGRVHELTLSPLRWNLSDGPVVAERKTPAAPINATPATPEPPQDSGRVCLTDADLERLERWRRTAGPDGGKLPYKDIAGRLGLCERTLRFARDCDPRYVWAQNKLRKFIDVKCRTMGATAYRS
jgi:hypothetical protein